MRSLPGEQWPASFPFLIALSSRITTDRSTDWEALTTLGVAACGHRQSSGRQLAVVAWLVGCVHTGF